MQLSDFDERKFLQTVEDIAEIANKELNDEEKKNKGQYFTPISIATYMAKQINLGKANNLKILDPGAGTGVLTAALADRIIKEQRKINLVVDLYERDLEVLPFLRETLDLCVQLFNSKGLVFQFNIIENDFIIDNKSLFFNGLLQKENTSLYDIIISNPPYYKVNKQHEYSKILIDYIYGQPNVYFMFMAVAEKLLNTTGQLVFITPRSFCSGAYFEKFREKFFAVIDPDHIHLFGSRSGNFKSQKVLQENIIISGFKRWPFNPYITISSSSSLDIKDDYNEEVYEKSLVLDSFDQKNMLRLPLNDEDKNTLELFDNWTNTLSQMNMDISTGPVVTFRHKEYLSKFLEEENYPLLLMKHIKDVKINFPISSDEKGVIAAAEKRRLLLDSRNYVLLKRFTSKEQKKRVDGAPYIADAHNFKKIGLENHLNYIHKVNQSLTSAETYGLAAFLNSSLVDRYFRIINGNTQVNASDIVSLPLPEYEIIEDIGNKIIFGKLTFENVDKYIADIISNPKVYTSKEGDKMTIEDEALQIISELELEKRQQNSRSALTLLALLGLKVSSEWKDAQQKLMRVVDIMSFMKEHHDKEYAANSRETIRRQTLHQFEQAGLISRNPDDQTRPTNSGKTVYAVTDEFLRLVQSFNTSEWDNNLLIFKDEFSTLKQKYEKIRNTAKIPIQLDEKVYKLSAGEHNILQKKIIHDFRAHFADKADVLYFGDTANKSMHIKEEKLKALNVPSLNHDKLPDVVLYDESRNWLFLIEAVTTHGPISNKRYYELEKMFRNSSAGTVYVTAFLSIQDFKSYADDIAWETEVWFADLPAHMMHYNGDRFLGPR
ncbi:BsuBI/PstI family type II restriction endonuclease [Geomicrobium sediminis]|uniref:site-specific DNA-methyltransferase (adenine-specific) n=1 Tax=Geomicrobium sediminis TaxID=1347788 RepID=A0ABS2P6I4_9BACL|nr:BsuBI/PstI family type II restriction endonuclease [Geomicrobium sediminis]MBM7631014.1 adenine-specific DNA-methyltransferase [Geomicrobium sediminis]